MKRKFLAFSLCIALCLSSMLLFSACKEKPVPVGEVEAGEAFNSAMMNLEEETVIKMNYDFMGMRMIMITSEQQTYMFVSDTLEMWSVKEGDVCQQHTITNVSYTDEPEYEYVKSTVPAVDNTDSSTLEELLNSATNGAFGDMSSIKFVSASKLNGEMTIKLELSGLGADEGLSYIFRIRDNKFTSFGMDIMGFEMTFNFSYGESLLAEIPTVPTLDKQNQTIEWDEYKPYIEVEGLKDYYTLGETIDLEDLTLKFYLDENSYQYEEFEITMDMISGFSSSEVNSGTIVVTFCGLTFEQEYTCK